MRRHHNHWADVVSRLWANTSACRLLDSLSCAARSGRSSICPGRLSTVWLVSLVAIYCHECGLQIGIREVHRSYFSFLTLMIISRTFVLSLTQMLGFLSLCVLLGILISMFVCAATSLFCACLVSVQGGNS